MQALTDKVEMQELHFIESADKANSHHVETMRSVAAVSKSVDAVRHSQSTGRVGFPIFGVAHIVVCSCAHNSKASRALWRD